MTSDPFLSPEPADFDMAADRENLKPIRLSDHAREQLRRRGGTEQEVAEAIRSASWEPASWSRFECRRDFPYDGEWNGRLYETKQVRPIFVDEPTEIVVITVYAYFF